MSKDILIELISQGLSTWKIATKLNVSQCKVRYWMKKYKLKTQTIIIDKETSCLNCNTELSGNQLKFCSPVCKNRYNNNWYNSGEKQKQRGIIKKSKLIKLKGGQCQNCGYDKCLRALTFHHRNPSEKSFPLDVRTCAALRWDKIYNEHLKCDLLCFNCHMEIEDEIING